MKGRIVALLSTFLFLIVQWPTYFLLGVQEYPLTNRGVILHPLDRTFEPIDHKVVCENGMDCLQKMCNVYKHSPNTSYVAFNPLVTVANLPSCDIDMAHLNEQHPQYVFMFSCMIAMTVLSVFHTFMLFSKNRIALVNRDKNCLILLCAWIGSLFIALNIFQGTVFLDGGIPLQVILPSYICQIVIGCISAVIIAMYWVNGYHTSIYEIIRD
uniref:Transmembrane protein n=1 Tax=Clandestinovirus TaxID=2831644 RepID=A0A8F8KU16_9VIRU|nr:transmembrane protein [Clandestinovirus]